MAPSDLDSSPDLPSPCSGASIDPHKTDPQYNRLIRELVYNRSPCPSPEPPSGRRLSTPDRDASAAALTAAANSIDAMIDEYGPLSPNTSRLYAGRPASPASPDNRDISVLLPNTSVEQAETIVKQSIAWREEDAPLPGYRSDGDYDFEGEAQDPTVNVMATDLFGFLSEKRRKLKKPDEFTDIIYDDDDEEGCDKEGDDSNGVVGGMDGVYEEEDVVDDGGYDADTSDDAVEEDDGRSWEIVDSEFNSDNDWEAQYGGYGTSGAEGARLPLSLEGSDLEGVCDQFSGDEGDEGDDVEDIGGVNDGDEDVVKQEEEYRGSAALLLFPFAGNDFEDVGGAVDGGADAEFSGDEDAAEMEVDNRGDVGGVDDQLSGHEAAIVLEEEYRGHAALLPFSVEGNDLEDVGGVRDGYKDAAELDGEYGGYAALLPFSVEGNDVEGVDGVRDEDDDRGDIGGVGDENPDAVEIVVDEHRNLPEVYGSPHGHDHDHSPPTLRGGWGGYGSEEEDGREVGGGGGGTAGKEYGGQQGGDVNSRETSASSNRAAISEGLPPAAPVIAPQASANDGGNMTPLAMSETAVAAEAECHRVDKGKGRAVETGGGGLFGADSNVKRRRDDDEDEDEDIWRGGKHGRVDQNLVADSGPSRDNHHNHPPARGTSARRGYKSEAAIRVVSGIFRNRIFRSSNNSDVVVDSVESAGPPLALVNQNWEDHIMQNRAFPASPLNQEIDDMILQSREDMFPAH